VTTTNINEAQERQRAMLHSVAARVAELVRAETLPHRQATAIERRRADRAEAECSRLRREVANIRDVLRAAREADDDAALRDGAKVAEGLAGVLANGEGETGDE
jgi:hypothetical protein